MCQGKRKRSIDNVAMATGRKKKLSFEDVKRTTSQLDERGRKAFTTLPTPLYRVFNWLASLTTGCYII
jgi:hypothetical protein